MAAVASMSQTERLEEALRRGVLKLGPEVQQQFAELLTAQNLAIAAGFFLAWLVSHAIGIGMIIDAIMIGVGVLAIGLAVFDGIGELMAFGEMALQAQSEPELDAAAGHFTKAVGILGVQTIIVLLLRRSPRTYRGGAPRLGAMPPAQGWVYRPGLRGVRGLPPGEGFTTEWGDIFISRLGSPSDRRLVALHESLHRFLTPRLDILRRFRVQNRWASYQRSALRKYLEEAFAEALGQVGVYGVGKLPVAFGFPVTGGYVTVLVQRTVVIQGRMETLMPVVPEVAGLLIGTMNVGGTDWNIYHHSHRPQAQP
jgi:hypothetical protein